MERGNNKYKLEIMSEKKETFKPRPYMELAIEEMNKSLNEPRPDGKVPPKVGAILLFPDGKVERAHRGELRDGDHAEFTLLDRKLGDKKLDDCILFTTLEPCVERTPPKIACCKRTSKARIKTVYVGITDPDHTVDGKGIKHLEDRHIKVIMFDRDLQKIIEDENSEFIKQANERKKKKEKDDFLTPIEKPIKTADLSQFSEEALNKFIAEAKLSYKFSDKSFHEYLADVGVVQFDDKDKVFRPTGFGILLFGKNPRSKYKQAAFMASVEYGKNKVEPKTFDQALVLIPDLVKEWLLKVLPLAKDTSSFKRKDIPDFPIKVLREAIINALVHRDYENEGAKSSIEIDDNKIVLKSPGAPLPSISLEQLNSFNAPSISRNPMLTYIFSLMDYVEEKGFGMQIFKSLNKDYGLPIPKYTFKDPFLTLTFPRTVEAVKDIVGKSGINELSSEDLKNFEIFREKRPVSKSEFVEFSGLAVRTAERYLKEWVDKGLLIRISSGPTTKYQIND